MKGAPFPASSLAWPASGLAPPIRARRPAWAHPPLCVSIKSRPPSRFSFFLHLSFTLWPAPSLLHGSAPLSGPSIADRRVSTMHEHIAGLPTCPLSSSFSERTAEAPPFIRCSVAPQPRCSSARMEDVPFWGELKASARAPLLLDHHPFASLPIIV